MRLHEIKSGWRLGISEYAFVESASVTREITNMTPKVKGTVFTNRKQWRPFYGWDMELSQVEEGRLSKRVQYTRMRLTDKESCLRLIMVV